MCKSSNEMIYNWIETWERKRVDCFSFLSAAYHSKGVAIIIIFYIKNINFCKV